MLAGLAPARRRLVVAVLVLVLAGAAVLIGLLVSRSAAPTPTRPAAERPPGPVLLVPGYGGATGGLRSLAGRLTAAGRDAHVVPLPGDGTGDLSLSADALGTAVTATLHRTGAQSVDLVGYSAGGVIVRLWIADGHEDVVRRVVTLGSPHHGTVLAAAGPLFGPVCPIGCRQLAPGSDLLRQLNAGDETPDGPRWLSIWSTTDEVVTPPETARLDGARNVVLQGICPDVVVHHGEFPASPLVVGLVLRSLGPGSLPRPTRADCADLTFAGG